MKLKINLINFLLNFMDIILTCFLIDKTYIKPPFLKTIDTDKKSIK